MKIGVVLPNPPTYSETFFNFFINGLIEEDHEIIVFTKSKDKITRGFPVISQYSFSKNNFWNGLKVPIILIWIFVTRMSKILKYLKLLNRDGIRGSKAIKFVYFNGHILRQSLDWLYFGFGTMAIGREQVAKAIDSRMAVSIRGYDISISPLGKSGFYDLTWKYLDKLHYLSDDLLAKIYGLGFPKDKLTIKITPATDITKINFEGHSSNKDSKIRIITVARLHWKKGLDYALVAMKKLRDKDVDFSYSIIGSGDEFERLYYMIHQFGLTKQVNLLGKKSHEEVIKLLLNHEIFLMPSVQEGFCNSVLEAQACGCLCIVSDAEGLPENVIHNKTGWVVKKRNPGEIAKIITTIANLHPMDQELIRRRARLRIEEEFNLDDQIDHWVDFFSKV